mmetsp:Transcript_24237/g.67388  ORF Transcript_24237/g.67388 Transcript_24237/m.67388 type:complete len:294 (+) Transcript_24237:511-1392(+)
MSSRSHLSQSPRGEGPDHGGQKQRQRQAAAEVLLRQAVSNAPAVAEDGLSGSQKWHWNFAEGWDVDPFEPPPVYTLKPEGEEVLGVKQLQAKVRACLDIMDSAYAALTLADKYGQKWSRLVPGLGSDSTCRSSMATAEELLAVLRNVADIVAAEQSLLFGPYQLPHHSALSPEGIPCFLSSVPAMQGAMEFAQIGNARWRALGEAFELLAHLTEKNHPLHCLRCGSKKLGPPPYKWEQLRQHLLRLQQRQIQAYMMAWLGVAREYGDMGTTAEMPGYAIADVLRMHVVMFHIA